MWLNIFQVCFNESNHLAKKLRIGFIEIGTSFDPSKQQTNELIDSNSEDKCVVAGILQPGYKFKNGTVVR